MMRLLAAIGLLASLLVGSAAAHDLRPAYLAITESAEGTYSVLWKVPALGDLRLALYPRFSEALVESPRESAFLSDSYVERWQVHAPDGLAGETIAVDGLSSIRTDVLVRIERLDGSAQVTRLTSGSPAFVVEAAVGWIGTAWSYFGLGVEHILLGFDHLLFVLALVLLVGGWRRVALTVTAFTAAHSITLAAATLGVVHAPGPPVEATIALSIAFVAAEIVNAGRGRQSLTARLPWLVAFVFGLLHGLGFAGALAEIGLPEHAIPLALLFFNLGVEAGQLAFVAFVLALISVLHVLSRVAAREVLHPAWARSAAAYGIGGVASFWLIERVSGFWA